ncbi:MAG: hypothetical protein Q7J24_05585, partial [Desulfomicrobium sp.]|nr:hypothetical protein [Desulfomicrobium sp.]
MSYTYLQGKSSLPACPAFVVRAVFFVMARGDPNYRQGALAGVRIPDKLTSDSTANCPPVPAETDQEIGAKRRWFWDAMGTGQLGSMR